MAGGLFVLPKMHKITQNSLLKKHGIFCLTFSFSHFLKIILAIVFLLCYNNSAFRMAADSLFVPVYKKRVSRGEEAARGTN